MGKRGKRPDRRGQTCITDGCAGCIGHHLANRCPACIAARGKDRNRLRPVDTAAEYCTIGDAAALLRVSEWQIYQLQRQLGFKKVGGHLRAPRSAIDDFFRSGE